ncbi:MAG TPA: type II secretion system protein [Gemmatimonadales bacterium]|nr:type II secretion system protein [Gemmatimonadales bacterium]
MTGRHGFTLTELLVGMVLMGIVGVALTKLFVSQSRFYDRQAQMRRARFVTRTAINAALSDLRMVEATGGLVSATAQQVTVRVPYAIGIVCANSPVQTTLSLWPVDSTVYATAGFGGYVWRDSVGNETYVEAGSSLVTDAASVCTAAGVTVLAGGRVVAVRPALPAALPAVTAVGTPVFLIQRLTYEFKASTTLPGRTALWRTVVGTGQTDELVAPFDSTASFAFYVAGSDTAQAAVPVPLNTMRGLQLNLAGQSEQAPEGTSTPRRAVAVTAVFYNNQIK